MDKVIDYNGREHVISNAMATTNYPENFRYKQSHFEGTHTSYTWQSSKYRDQVIAKIVGETKSYYIVELPCGSKRFKKENIEFA